MESLCIKVNKKAGENTRRKLIELGAIDQNLKIRSEDDKLLIPVVRPLDGFGRMSIEDFEVLKKEKTPAELLGFAPAYEQIGDIAIIERHEPDIQRIADVLMRQKRIKTVLAAETSISGEYRTRKLSIVGGEKRTEALYRENGCRYMIDIARVYFTPRLATERMRIADRIKNGDKVVDMFAGVGPFSILIAKKFPASQVIAIDKNPDAVKYLKLNVILNKVKNVEIREGDARERIRGITEADHIIMNLPHSGLEFLDAALGAIRKGGVIHLYAITHEDDLFGGILSRIEEIAHQSDMQIVTLDKRVVRPYAPYQYNICVDLMVI